MKRHLRRIHANVPDVAAAAAAAAAQSSGDKLSFQYLDKDFTSIIFKFYVRKTA
jgi:hypothetical protein